MGLGDPADLYGIWGDYTAFVWQVGARRSSRPEFFLAWLVVAGRRGVLGPEGSVKRTAARELYRKHKADSLIDQDVVEQMTMLVAEIMDAKQPTEGNPIREGDGDLLPGDIRGGETGTASP